MTHYKISAINDHSNSHFVKHERFFDLPSRLLLCGPSQSSGKTTTVINLLAKPEFYGNYFDGNDIFLFCPTASQESWQMFINNKQIPKQNIKYEFDAYTIRNILDMLKEEFEMAKMSGEQPTQKLLLFDDLAFSGVFSSNATKKENLVNELFCNSRHYLVSVWVLGQHYAQFSPVLRNNATALIIWDATNKQWANVADDYDNTENRKEFLKAMKNATKKPYNFVFINKLKRPRFYHMFETPILEEKEN